jgi:cyclic pyranopterin phosphate synthase
VEKIRITGGEPLIRKGVMDLIGNLSGIEGLRELVLTTNGSHLASMALDLKRQGIRRVNISLDTLDAARFKEMTRTGSLGSVLEGIEAARAVGFDRIKLNSVILRHRNDDQILPLVAFAVDRGLDVSFIEEMPLGVIDSHDRGEAFMPSHEVRAVVASGYDLVASEDQTGGPSRYFRLKGTQSRVGFISPHSHNFCGDCNRVRLTAEGRLLTCLGNEHSKDLRQVVREAPHDLESAIREAIALKPERHHFTHEAKPVIFRHMNVTGG